MLLVFSLFMYVLTVRAASLTSMKDTLTNETVNETSDHWIGFNVPSGIAVNQTLIMTFEGFSIDASLTFDDVDLLVDSVGDGVCLAADDGGPKERTMAAAPTTTSWGVVRTSATVLTFTAPSTGAPVSAGYDLCIEIGTNAENGAGADHQITNPSSVGDGSYTISFSGTMSDSGSLAVPILDSDQVSVTANVDATMTFDLDTAVTDTDSNEPYTVNLGAITSTDTRVSGSTDGINGIWMDVDSNASNGIVVTVENLNGASGLVSASVGGDFIPASGGDLADGTSMYGLCVVAVSATDGTPERAGDYVSPTICAFNNASNDVEALSIIPTSILSSSGPIVGGRAQIAVGASINATVPAHNDYTDTLTFIATGTF